MRNIAVGNFCAGSYEPHPLTAAIGRYSSASCISHSLSQHPEGKMSTEPEAEGERAFSRGKTFRGKGVDDSWKKIQERTFTNWVNDRLRGNLKVAKKQVSTYSISSSHM